MLLYYRPRHKDFGAEFLFFNAPLTVTANTTVTTGLGGVSDKDTAAPNVAHTAYVDEIHVGFVTVPVDNDGTTLFALKKYDASANGAVTLASAFNLEGLTTGEVDKVPFDSGVTDQQRMLDYGDFLYIEVVNNSAGLDTAAVGGAATVLVKLIT